MTAPSPDLFTDYGDFLQIRVPVPFPLRFVNCYLFQGADGWNLIDTGLNYPEARATWQAALPYFGIRPGEIRRIYLTHYHPDHYGLAGWFQQWTGAKVHISSIDLASTERFWNPLKGQQRQIADFFAGYGLPVPLAQAIEANMRDFLPFVQPAPELTTIEANTPVELLPDTAFLPLHTPGHLVFYSPKRRWLIAGDALLPKISPNVSLWPGCDPNPLKSFQQSLALLQSLEIDRVLPAHGPVFTDHTSRIAQLFLHHRQRLDQTARLADGKTAWEICQGLFPGCADDLHHLRFALSETIAHLVYLEKEGRVARQGTPSPFFTD